MTQDFSEALNDCLELLIQGEDLQTCLNRHPEHALELRPLLQVAMATMRVAENVQPSASSKARNFERFTQAVAESANQPARRSSWLSFRWLPVARPIAISLVSLALIVMGAGATTAASANSVEGEALYWVKTTRENIETRFRRSDEGKANYEAVLAQKRSDEVRKLIERGHLTRADNTMKRMNVHLQRSARYAGVTVTITPVEMPPRAPVHVAPQDARKLKDRFENDRRNTKNELNKILNQLPPEYRRQAEQFIHQMDLRYGLLIDAMQIDAPGERPLNLMEPRRGPRPKR